MHARGNTMNSNTAAAALSRQMTPPSLYAKRHGTCRSGGGANGRGGGGCFLARPPLDPRAPNAFFRVPPNVDNISLTRGIEKSANRAVR